MTDRREIGVAVVGLGWTGQVHTRAWARLAHNYCGAPLRPRCVAVADPDAGRRHPARARLRFADAVESWEKLLDRDDLDVVSVCSPSSWTPASVPWHSSQHHITQRTSTEGSLG